MKVDVEEAIKAVLKEDGEVFLDRIAKEDKDAFKSFVSKVCEKVGLSEKCTTEKEVILHNYIVEKALRALMKIPTKAPEYSNEP